MKKKPSEKKKPFNSRAEVYRLLHNPPGTVKLKNIYRLHLGQEYGFDIWGVDSGLVGELIYPHFFAGGNPERYLYEPEGDIWIDCFMGLIEYHCTLHHELGEHFNMRVQGMGYNCAHNQELAEELKRRRGHEQHCAGKELGASGLWAPFLNKSGCVPDSVTQKQHRIYRAFYDTVAGVDVYVVDGWEVRRMFDGNFPYAQHGLAAKYIPRREVWMDMHISIEAAWYALKQVLAERQAMLEGCSVDEAEEIGLAARLDERRRQSRLCARHEAGLQPVPYGCRNRGRKLPLR